MGGEKEHLDNRLIPRDVIFGDPEKWHARISPDGTSLTYLAPSDGKMSVWVRTLGEDDGRVIAHDPARAIPWVAWQGDGDHVLYLQDSGGNENYHLFQVNVTTKAVRELTPGENVRCVPLAVDHRFPNEALVMINERDPQLMDVYRVDFRSGALTLVAENAGDVSMWLADNDFVVRGALAQLEDGSTCIRVRKDADATWSVLDTFASADGLPRMISFSPDNGSLYVITAKGASTVRLVRYDVANGSYTVLLEDPKYDVHTEGILDVVNAAFVDPASRKLLAAAVLRERLSWHPIDPSFAGVLASLKAQHDADFMIEGASADGNTLVIRYVFDVEPNHYYVFDRNFTESTFLFVDRPALFDYTLAPMRPISFVARDGLEIHGYLTLPIGDEVKNLPTVLYVHGGPWHRDRWGYEDFVQWLANRGYAVLQVNFRGSTGYGKAFVNAGNRQWAGSMRTDLLDARDWAIAQGFSDPKRFGILGASYGGYAVLTALTFTPDAFTCGVDIVGPSNLNTVLASVPPYWKTFLKIFHERMGEDPKFLDAQSPLLKADAIRAPLLIAHGANDPRVKQQESDQIVEVLRKNHIPVTYMVFENEGHGFAEPENIKRFAALTEKFLADTLGGRLQPAAQGEDVEPLLR